MAGKLIERDIETYLRNEVKKAGGKAYKFISPGNDGAPDRIVIFPGNRIYFIELKRPGGKPRPLQIKKITELLGLGCHVAVIDTKAKVDNFVRTVIEREI